jgi:hypothetical protein
VRKNLTITLDEAVHDALCRAVGQRHISRFIEDLVRPHVIAADLSAAYAEMAATEARESEAGEWADALLRDVGDESG